MATWDSKERELFTLDAEKLKDNIDAIQSQKIESLRDDLNRVVHKFNSLTNRSLEAQQNELYRLNRELKTSMNKVNRVLWIGALFIPVIIIQGVILWLRLRAS